MPATEVKTQLVLSLMTRKERTYNNIVNMYCLTVTSSITNAFSHAPITVQTAQYTRNQNVIKKFAR